jgi:hypothetical protein
MSSVVTQTGKRFAIIRLIAGFAVYLLTQNSSTYIGYIFSFSNLQFGTRFAGQSSEIKRMRNRDIIIRLKQMGYTPAHVIGERTIVPLAHKVPHKKDWADFLNIWHNIVWKANSGRYGITINVDRQGRPVMPTFDTRQWKSDGLDWSERVQVGEITRG